MRRHWQYLRMFSLGLALISLNLSLLPVSRCQAEESIFGDLDRGLVRSEDAVDQACCDRASYSKSFDHWIESYVSGRNEEAAKDWAGVLTAAKGTTNLYKLMSSVSTRLQFLEGDQSEQLENRGGEMPAFKSILITTEKICGASSLQVASVLDFLTHKYSSRQDYKIAASYAIRALKIKESHWGKDSPRLFGSFAGQADMEIQAKDYSNAKLHAERAMAIAVKCRSGPAQYRAKTILTKLVKLNAK